MKNKTTKKVHWITQGDDFNTNYTSNVEMVLTYLDATKSVTCNFHMDNLQDLHRYDMILGRNVFYELNIE